MISFSITGSRLVVCAVFAVTWIGLSGCDFVDQPDRFIDESVELPVVTPVDYTSVRSGQHLAGHVVITANLDTLASTIERVVLTVDGRQVDHVDRAPFVLTLNTADFAEGQRTLALEIYEANVQQGLLGLAGAPSRALVTPVVFDQTPPTGVENLSGAWTDSGVTMTWTPNTNPNFYAYLVVRTDTWSDIPDGGSIFGGRTTILDTLYDASIQTYTDVAVPSVYGLRSEYGVIVSNRAQYVGGANVDLEYGSRTFIEGYKYDPLIYGGFTHPKKEISFTSNGYSLNAVRTRTGEFIALANIGDHLQQTRLTGSAAIVGISQDGTEVYVFTADPASGVMTTELFAFSATEQPTFRRRLDAFPNDAFQLRLGPDGTIVARANDQIGLYDTADGQLRTVLSGVTSGARTYRVGDALFTQELSANQSECVLRKHDLITGQPAQQATYPFDGMSCWNVHASASGNTMLLVSTMESRFRRVDPASTTISSTIDFPVASGELVDRVYVDDNRLYLGVSILETPYQRGRILNVDAIDLSVIRSWDFTHSLDRVLPSVDGTALYAYAFDYPTGWVWQLTLAE